MERLDDLGALAEGERLELKRAAVLTELEKLSRSVVAMLNARGGDLYVGVLEHEERAIGTEDIPRPAIEQRRIEDHLVAAIEPAIDREIAITALTHGDHTILRIRVTPDVAKQPYAAMRAQARLFLIRVGGRVRAMTREEIRQRFRAERSEDPPSGHRRMEQRWTQEVKEGRRELWVSVLLEPPTRLGRSRDAEARIARVLRDPDASGNRAMGWSFCSEYEQPRRDGELYVLGGPASYTWTEVDLGKGSITFRAPIERLQHRTAGEVYPYALVEYPASAIRIASALYAACGAPEERAVVASVGLAGTAGLTLRPGTPREIAFELDARPLPDEPTTTGPMTTTMGELARAADAFAWELVQALYDRLGFWANETPAALFDQESRRIVFPR